MKVELYKCDFCKENVKKEQLIYFNFDIKRFEVCKNCYNQAESIVNEYENEVSKLFDMYSKRVENLIKERKINND